MWDGGIVRKVFVGANPRTPKSRLLPVRRNSDGSVSGRLQAREVDEIVSHDRGPDVGLKVVKAAPRAVRQAISALEP